MAEFRKQTAPDSSPLEIVVEQLACPVCLGELRMGAAGLVCVACARVFPVVDGIPVLIAGEPI
jgi:hypothetical protein